MLEHAAAALFLDPGLGKTSVSLAALKILKKKRMFEKALVVAPINGVFETWPDEMKKWTDFHGFKWVVLHGPNKDELLQEEADIYLINPEGLDWLLDMEKVKSKKGKNTVTVDVRRFKKFGFDILILDELQMYKHHSTNRYKGLKEVIHTFGRRWGLTGSPTANGLMDLFGQCFILDEGRTFGPYFTNFRKEYFYPGENKYEWNLKDGAEQKIYRRVKPLALRMDAEDYIDMPKVIENNIWVSLPEAAQAVYDDVERDLFAQIDKRTVTAANCGVKSMKCSQIASGGVFLDEEVEALVKLPSSKREWVNLHMTKVEALARLIDELQGEPILVAYDFRHDLDRLTQQFGKDIPIIGGGVSRKKVTELKTLWNQGKLKWLFGHPQSIGRSMNLQGASCKHVAWHSMIWNYELYDQYIRRIRRQGNKAKRVFVHHIMVRNTLDEVKLMALKSKEKGQQAFFKALKTYRAQKR